MGRFNGYNNLRTEEDYLDDGPSIRGVGLPNRYCQGYRGMILRHITKPLLHISSPINVLSSSGVMLMGLWRLLDQYNRNLWRKEREDGSQAGDQLSAYTRAYFAKTLSVGSPGPISY